MMNKRFLVIVGLLFFTMIVVAQTPSVIHSRPQWINITDVEAFKVYGNGGNITLIVDSSTDLVKSRTILPLKVSDDLGTPLKPFDEVVAKRYRGQRENLYTDSPITCEAMCKTLETIDPASGTWTCYGAIRYDRYITTCQDGALPRNCICQN